jgi:hypothetical protein
MWTTAVLTELNIPYENTQDDADVVNVKFKGVAMLVRLSSCRIVPSGVNISQSRRLPLMDKDCLPRYDKEEFIKCRELASIIMRGSKSHEKIVWIRNSMGNVIGLK